MPKPSSCWRFRGAVLAAALLLASASHAAAGQITVTLEAGAYRLVDTPAGQHWVAADGSEPGQLLEPGAFRLPAEQVLLLLPPGARAVDLEVVLTGTVRLPGTYRLRSAPPLLTMSGTEASRARTRQLLAAWDADRRVAAARDEAYPAANVRITGTGTLGPYAYVAVSFCPFTYHPRSGRLDRHAAARVRIAYRADGAPARLAAVSRTTARARRLFANFEQMRIRYLPSAEAPYAIADVHDYVIVTTAALVPAVQVSGFVEHKTARGHAVRIVTTTDPEITAQPGADLAARIRNFLRAAYAAWGVEYVLLVGDHAAVPVRYCFADPTDHSHAPANYPDPGGSVPTDHYYADLSYPDDLSWDADGDGYHGEYGQDAPDFLAEVAVGRIPTADPARVTYALAKSVRFEQDTGAWKYRALHGGAVLFYANQDHSSLPFRDGAVCLDLIETNLMPGWTVDRFCEHEGLDPSTYSWGALTETSFTSAWREGSYGVVNWSGHGRPDAARRTIWLSDDGDGVYETDGSDGVEDVAFIAETSVLEDDHPSIVFAVSCNVGYPEPNPNGNLGVRLVTDPALGAAVGILASSRVAAVTGDWPATPGGAESMCYEFNRHFLAGPAGPARLGDAFYDSKYFCHYYYGWAHYLQYWNMYDYDLYGDPALELSGAVSAVRTDDGSGVAAAALLLRNHPNPFNPRTVFRFRLEAAGSVSLAIFDARGRRVRVLVADEWLAAGDRVVSWGGLDDGGRQAPSGVYFCRLRAGGKMQQRKVLLLK